MTVVNCMLENCEYNNDCTCTAPEITLYDDHLCSGGCDDGWKMTDDNED